MKETKYLMVCGSIAPTYCGVGKFAARMVSLLQKNGINVTYLTNTVQVDLNKNQDSLLEVKTFTANLRKNGLLSLFRLVRSQKPDICNFQYQSFGRNYFDSIFPLIVKLASPKAIKVVTIHEYSVFSNLGKARLSLAMWFADRVLFSDSHQLVEACKNNSWLSLKSAVIFIGPGSDKFLSSFSYPKFESTLNLGFHGLIQPGKGLDVLVDALSRFKHPFKLHILGEFKPLLAYGDNGLVKEYQNMILQKIEKLKARQGEVIIYGDIEPGSDRFREILSEVELAVFPFTDYLTARRSSFCNVLLNSNCIMASSYKEGFSDAFLNKVLSFEPNEEEILNFLNNYVAKSISEKQKIADQQKNMRQYYIDPQREKNNLELLLGGFSSVDHSEDCPK